VRIALYIAIGILALVLLFGLRIAAKSFHEERADYVRTPSSAISRHPERAEIPGLIEISFPSADGFRMAGWYAASRNRAAVVLVHGTGADRSSLLAETRILAEAGFGVLALDLPGQGQSEGTASNQRRSRLAERSR